MVPLILWRIRRQSVCSILEWLADWPVRGRRQKSSIMISIWKTTSHLRCSSWTGWCYARCLKSHEWHPDQNGYLRPVPRLTLDLRIILNIRLNVQPQTIYIKGRWEYVDSCSTQPLYISRLMCCCKLFSTTKWTENDAPSRQLTFYIVVRLLGNIIFDTNRRYCRRFHLYYIERMIIAIFYVLVNAVWLWTQGRVSSASISSIWQLW